MKKTLKATLITVAITVAVIPTVYLIWFFLESLCLLPPYLPVPEITYAEFPFALEYEVDGVFHKYEDILICQYNGEDMNMGSGKKQRSWTACYKSGNQQIVLYQDENIDIFLFPCVPNSGDERRTAAILMGDSEIDYSQLTEFPDALYKSPSVNYKNGKWISAEELLSKYKIRLISWKCAEPIKNTFK